MLVYITMFSKFIFRNHTANDDNNDMRLYIYDYFYTYNYVYFAHMFGLSWLLRKISTKYLSNPHVFFSCFSRLFLLYQNKPNFPNFLGCKKNSLPPTKKGM